MLAIRLWLCVGFALLLNASTSNSAAHGSRSDAEEDSSAATAAAAATGPLQEFKIFLDEPAQQLPAETEHTAVAYSSRNERSLLLVLQDQLAEQGELLGQLKDSLTAVQAAQADQKKSIDDIYKKVNDHTWAVASLKSAQDLAATNYGQVKQMCSSQAAVLSQENGNLSRAVGQLSSKVVHLEKAQLAATKVIHQLIVTGLSNDTLASAIDDTAGDASANNGASGIAAGDEDGSEEENNLIERPLVNWDKMEQTLRHSLAAVRHDLRRHEDELHGMRSILYDTAAHTLRLYQEQQVAHNLSFAFALNETTSVAGRVASIEHQIQDLAEQREVMRSMESTLASTVELSRMTAQQLTLVQESATEQIRFGEIQYDSLMSQLAQMNATLRALSERELTNLYSNVSSRTNAVKERNDMLWSQIRIVDSRLAQVEVRYLREELNNCKRDGDDLSAKLRLREIEDDLKVIFERLRIQADVQMQVDKLLSRLEQAQKASNESISGVYQTFGPLLRELVLFPKVVADVESLLGNLPKDCTDEFARGSRGQGTYLIRLLNTSTPLRVQCLLGSPQSGNSAEDYTGDNGAWLIVQRRKNGIVSFDRTWQEYKNGFGDAESGGDFWIGNERLHRITSQDNYTVRFDMWTNATYFYAEYDYFRVHGERANYRLDVRGTYRGTASDSLSSSNGMSFSTKDVDNDSSSTHCAMFYQGGWWYKHCQYCNLNGRFLKGMTWFHHDLEEWLELTATTMRLRRLVV